MTTYNEKIKLKTQILKLSKDDWKAMCKYILIPNNEKITINQQCVCFCLLKLSEKSIKQIQEYILHHHEN
jgi:hypothetical protein